MYKGNRTPPPPQKKKKEEKEKEKKKKESLEQSRSTLQHIMKLFTRKVQGATMQPYNPLGAILWRKLRPENHGYRLTLLFAGSSLVIRAEAVTVEVRVQVDTAAIVFAPVLPLTPVNAARCDTLPRHHGNVL